MREKYILKTKTEKKTMVGLRPPRNKKKKTADMAEEASKRDTLTSSFFRIVATITC